VLAAVGSRTRSSAESYANKWSIPLAFGSYKELIESDEVDIIYNPLPNHLHAEWTIRALNAGKHVLCEKPLVLDPQDVVKIADAAKTNHKIVAEAFMYRHHPQTNQLKKLISDGGIGEARFFTGSFGFTLQPSDQQYRWRKEYGGGSLWDVGVYPISMVQHLFGVPTSVYGSQKMSGSGIDLSFTGQLYYTNGFTASIFSSFETTFQTSVNVIGSIGTIHVSRPFVQIEEPDSVIKLYDNKNKERSINCEKADLYLGEVIDMHQSIENSKTPLISLTESGAVINTVLALYKSADLHEEVFL
jgi:predicted dehydrogenase